MDMRKCDVCGEMYSTTYRTCPFCEEEESIRRGKPIHRHAKDFRNKRGSHAAGVLLLVAVLILAGWGIFSLWGDNIAAALGLREANLPEDENGGASVTDPDNTGSGTDDPQMPTIDDPNNESETPSQEEPPETPVTLSSNDFTLTASGGSGSYTYSIDNTQVATVASDGWVTAVGNGTATVTVSDGYTTATCTVRVRGVSSSGGEGGTTTSGGTLTLSREDFTLNSTYPTYTITASGASGTVSWSSSDTSVATVDANGTVTRVGSGTCTITASCGSQTATCIVRVS